MAKWLPADRVTGRNPWTDTDFGRRFSGSLFTFGPEKDYRPTASRQTRQNVNGVPAALEGNVNRPGMSAPWACRWLVAEPGGAGGRAGGRWTSWSNSWPVGPGGRSLQMRDAVNDTPSESNRKREGGERLKREARGLLEPVLKGTSSETTTRLGRRHGAFLALQYSAMILARPRQNG